MIHLWLPVACIRIAPAATEMLNFEHLLSGRIGLTFAVPFPSLAWEKSSWLPYVGFLIFTILASTPPAFFPPFWLLALLPSLPCWSRLCCPFHFLTQYHSHLPPPPNFCIVVFLTLPSLLPYRLLHFRPQIIVHNVFSYHDFTSAPLYSTAPYLFVIDRAFEAIQACCKYSSTICGLLLLTLHS